MVKCKSKAHYETQVPAASLQPQYSSEHVLDLEEYSLLSAIAVMTSNTTNHQAIKAVHTNHTTSFKGTHTVCLGRKWRTGGLSATNLNYFLTGVLYCCRRRMISIAELIKNKITDFWVNVKIIFKITGTDGSWI